MNKITRVFKNPNLYFYVSLGLVPVTAMFSFLSGREYEREQDALFVGDLRERAKKYLKIFWKPAVSGGLLLSSMFATRGMYRQKIDNLIGMCSMIAAGNHKPKEVDVSKIHQEDFPRDNDIMIYDIMFDHYFSMTTDELLAAELSANVVLSSEGRLTVEELYTLFNVDTPPMLNNLEYSMGWDYSLQDELILINFEHVKIDTDEFDGLILSYLTSPTCLG